jgi:hypothetical protein
VTYRDRETILLVIVGGYSFSPIDVAVAMTLIGLTARDEIITIIEMKIDYLWSFN